MEIIKEILDDSTKNKLVTYISHYQGPKIKIMEVCGSHTKAIKEYGLVQILPSTIELVSGPGCPICVTPDAYLVDIKRYGQDEKTIIACFGDLLRLPQMQGISRKQIHMIYSPLDCLTLATTYKDKQVIFIAIAFETTAPLVAWVIKKASELGLTNLKIWCGLKRMIPALDAISQKSNTQGYLYPGHVAAILGEEDFRQISKKYSIPGVIAGFRMDELLLALGQLITLIEQEKRSCINLYNSVVSVNGNVLAQNLMTEIFEMRGSLWRGIGEIPLSGYGLKEAYKDFEILPCNEVNHSDIITNKACLCGLVVMGEKKPQTCPLWGKSCTPMHPQGVCMVTMEGACALAYQFEKGGKDAKCY